VKVKRSLVFLIVLLVSVGVWAAEPARDTPTSQPAGLPERQWRAVHLMAWGTAAGPAGLPSLKRAIAEVLAPLGVNVIIYEVNYHFAYVSHPELRHSVFITKAQARELADLCRKHGISLIPQFNCLGHQSWIRKKAVFPLLIQYPELEETPDVPREQWDSVPRSWCPLHPRVNEIILPMLDELIEAFQARAFHVGMDEVLVIGSSKCPRCRSKDPAKLFAQAVTDLHRHLVREKSLTMLMWGDRLLDERLMHFGEGWSASRNGTAGAIDLIPKDIIICDWHYSLREDYPSVRYFQRKGFRVLPASWRNGEAAVALIACAHREPTNRMLGHLCTTWTLEPGYFARALLGEDAPADLSPWAVESAAALRACMTKLDQLSPRR